MKDYAKILFKTILFASSICTGSYAFASPSNVPLNVIVLICDGWGYNHVDAESIYRHGQTGVQVYEGFPVQYAMSTFAIGGSYDPQEAWGQFDYQKQKLTDSAAAATAMATGVKTNNGAIGVDATGVPLKNIVQRSEELGKATGVITSVQLSHATPAGFVAHNVSRDNYVDIAQEMIFDSKVDVIMGTGHPYFFDNGMAVGVPNFKYVGGESTWQALIVGTAGNDADGDGVADAWTLIQDRSEFQSLMSGATPKRVIGVPKVRSTLQEMREGDPSADPYVVPLMETVPTLEEMTRAALNVLDNDPDGFFLMVEGGAVDWASHENLSGRMIEEQIDFDNAAEAVVAWVEDNSSWDETLVIVTGDHETGYLTGPGSGQGEAGPVWNTLVNNGQGNLPGMEWHSIGHTNALIPLFARGVGSELFAGYADQFDPVRGEFVDNTEIGQILFIVLEVPVVISIDPLSGTELGSTPVTITGRNFQSGATVTFDGSAADSVVVVSNSIITAVIPLHPAGTVDVIVANPDGEADTLCNGFAFVSIDAITDTVSFDAVGDRAAIEILIDTVKSNTAGTLEDSLLAVSYNVTVALNPFVGKVFDASGSEPGVLLTSKVIDPAGGLSQLASEGFTRFEDGRVSLGITQGQTLFIAMELSSLTGPSIAVNIGLDPSKSWTFDEIGGVTRWRRGSDFGLTGDGGFMIRTVTGIMGDVSKFPPGRGIPDGEIGTEDLDFVVDVVLRRISESGVPDVISGSDRVTRFVMDAADGTGDGADGIVNLFDVLFVVGRL